MANKKKQEEVKQESAPQKQQEAVSDKKTATKKKSESVKDEKTETKKSEKSADKKEQQAEKTPREPQLVTVNGEKVTHAHAFQSNKDENTWYFTAKLDGKQLRHLLAVDSHQLRLTGSLLGLLFLLVLGRLLRLLGLRLLGLGLLVLSLFTLFLSSSLFLRGSFLLLLWG